MTLSLKRYNDETVSFTAVTSAGEAEVRYRKKALTPKVQMELARAAKANDADRAGTAFLSMFADIIEFMDVAPGPLYDRFDRDENGAPRLVLAEGEVVPIDPDVLAFLPMDFLQEILSAVMQHQVDERGPKQESTEPVPLQRSEKSSKTGSFARTG